MVDDWSGRNGVRVDIRAERVRHRIVRRLKVDQDIVEEDVFDGFTRRGRRR